MKNVLLEQVKTYKYLGFQTDSLFSSETHMKYIMSKFRKAVFRYRKVVVTKNEYLQLKLLGIYTLPMLYGLELMNSNCWKRQNERFIYILSIALHRNTQEVKEFLVENPEYKLENIVNKAINRN